MSEVNSNGALPTGWKWVKLGDAAKFIDYRGKTPKKTNSGVPLITAKNVKMGFINDEPREFIAEKDYKGWMTRGFPKIDDVLFTTEAPLGNVAQLKKNDRIALAQRLITFQSREFLTNSFLKYNLLSPQFQKLLSSKGTGTTVKGIKAAVLKQLEIPIPPLPEQHTIVSKIEELLSELDKGKQQLETAQQQLKIYRQVVLKWAFEGKLSNENVKEGKLPEGWVRTKVSEISSVVRGGSPRPAGDPKYYDGDIPFLKVRDITKDNGIYLTSFEYTIKEAGLNKTRQIKPKTLLLSNSGATLGVPKICMINATMNDGIAAFLNLDERSNLYLYYFWVSKTRELRNINMGAAQPNLNTDIIKDYEVPYCSFEEQQLVVQEIESRLSVCNRVEETIATSLAQAETLRQSILKKAFEGKLL